MFADEMVFLFFESVDEGGRDTRFQRDHFQACCAGLLEGEEGQIEAVLFVKAVLDFLELGREFCYVFLNGLWVLLVNDCSFDEFGYS